MTAKSKNGMSSGASTETTQDRKSRSRHLHRMVILQAVRDYASGNERARNEVKRWMITPDFKLVCEEAGMNYIETGKLILRMDSVPDQDKKPMMQTIKALLLG
jgi:hypothetical protein